MLLTRKRREKKCTLQFRTKNGIRRSNPQNSLNEHTNCNDNEQQVMDYLRRENTDDNGDEISG